METVLYFEMKSVNKTFITYEYHWYVIIIINMVTGNKISYIANIHV